MPAPKGNKHAVGNKGGGRPTLYDPKYARQAKKLCLIFSASDEGLAFFFDVSLEDIAVWAWEHKEFFDAITPSDAEVAAYQAGVSARKAKRQARRKRLDDPRHRLLQSMRVRLSIALKSRRTGKLFSRPGYSLDDLVNHLETRFKEGMAWENYGKWHVDHVKPCRLFDHSEPSELAQCWSLGNLQPLWKRENLSKGGRYAGA